MSIFTFSKFYYGHTVTIENFGIDFDEGAGELFADLNPGDYTLSEFVLAIANALNTAGTQVYTVSVNRGTGRITISAPNPFDLLGATGSRVGISALPLAGFAASDFTGSNSYTGANRSGSEFKPQSFLWDYVEPDDNQEKNDAVVNTSATGEVQSVIFGDVSFIDFEIPLISNNPVSRCNESIEFNATGKSDANNFMKYAITKSKMEFMPDRDNPSNFYTVILEKTRLSRNGTAYKLYEREQAPGWFSSGDLTFRVVQ